MTELDEKTREKTLPYFYGPLVPPAFVVESVEQGLRDWQRVAGILLNKTWDEFITLYKKEGYRGLCEFDRGLEARLNDVKSREEEIRMACDYYELLFELIYTTAESHGLETPLGAVMTSIDLDAFQKGWHRTTARAQGEGGEDRIKITFSVEPPDKLLDSRSIRRPNSTPHGFEFEEFLTFGAALRKPQIWYERWLGQLKPVKRTESLLTFRRSVLRQLLWEIELYGGPLSDRHEALPVGRPPKVDGARVRAEYDKVKEKKICKHTSGKREGLPHVSQIVREIEVNSNVFNGVTFRTATKWVRRYAKEDAKST